MHADDKTIVVKNFRYLKLLLSGNAESNLWSVTFWETPSQQIKLNLSYFLVLVSNMHQRKGRLLNVGHTHVRL